MNTFAIFFNSTLLFNLGWTLIHFLWQGAAIGTLYTLLRYLLRFKSPVARYNLALITLITLAVLPVITFAYLVHAATSNSIVIPLNNLTAVTALAANSNPPTATSLLDTVHLWLKPLLSWAVLLWFLGVLIMSVRIGYGWNYARYLRRTASFTSLPRWNNVVQDLCMQLGVRKLVRLAVSLSIQVPSVIGWLKPVILLPPSVLSGLTPLQIELILAHELAHVRRCDHLWNLVQITVETLLFYHPVVRWVSNQVRIEREQCCDDMVVTLHGNPIAYARALTELEGLRNPQGALLLGANGGQVLNRIHRLLGSSAVGIPAACGPLLLAACLTFTGALIASTSQMRTLWHTALAAKYSLPGRQVASSPARKNLPVSVRPTHITQTSVIQVTSKYIHLAGNLSALHITPPLAVVPVTLDMPMSAPINVTAAHHNSIPTRSGGVVISRHAPQYPIFVQERGIEGDAKIEFTLTPGAEITDVRVIKITGSELFGKAAMRAIQKWKFTPVTLSGKPVAQQMTVDFVFRLHEASTQTDGPCKAPMGYHVCIN